MRSHLPPSELATMPGVFTCSIALREDPDTLQHYLKTKRCGSERRSHYCAEIQIMIAAVATHASHVCSMHRAKEISRRAGWIEALL